MKHFFQNPSVTHLYLRLTSECVNVNQWAADLSNIFWGDGRRGSGWGQEFQCRVQATMVSKLNPYCNKMLSVVFFVNTSEMSHILAWLSFRGLNPLSEVFISWPFEKWESLLQFCNLKILRNVLVFGLFFPFCGKLICLMGFHMLNCIILYL